VPALTGLGAGLLVADDFVAQVDAFVADEDRRAGNEFLDLVLTLAAKRAIQGLFGGRAFFSAMELRLETDNVK